MRLYSFVAAAALLSASLAAHADDIFTLTGDGQTFSFTLPASPTPDGVDNGPYFSVAVDHNGVTSSQVVLFDNTSDLGGLQLGLPPSLVNVVGPQLYTGPDNAPTFLLGTFALSNYPDNQTYPGDYIIDINTAPSAPTAVTPEPSSLALLGTGLLGAVGVMRKRFA